MGLRGSSPKRFEHSIIQEVPETVIYLKVFCFVRSFCADCFRLSILGFEVVYIVMYVWYGNNLG